MKDGIIHMNNFDKKYDRDLVSPFPNRDETKYSVCERRNKALLDFFTRVNMEISLIGNPQKPAIIVNNYYCLSAFVSNFDLHFTDAPFHGTVIKTYKLATGTHLSHNEFMDFFKNYEQRRVYKIKHSNTNLYLSGYNFKNREKSEGRYPVFSRFRFKIYFNIEKAEEIIKDYGDYPMEIE